MVTSTRRLLDEIPQSDTFAWNSLTQTHLTNKDPHNALSIYHQILLRVHGQAFKLAFSADHCVISALLDLYGRLDSIDSAKWVFVKSVKSMSNSVCWTILARLYLMQNQRSLALDLFHQMVNLDAYVDRVALATAVGACRLLKSMQEGRKAHGIATKYRLEFDVLVSNSIDCGSFADARAIFDRMPSKDVISWTETIVFSKLRISSCALKTMMDGTRFSYTFRNPVASCRIGKIHLKEQGIKVRDVISWTVMILGCSLHGQRARINTAGMVEEGWLCFNRIRSPKVTHHALMVSALARAGLFDEARIFIQEYHMERYPEVLRALLEGCRIHVQVKTGKRVIEQLCELKPLSAENYIMLSNWYAAEAKWDVVNQVMYPAQDQSEYFGSYSL
ncbi:hypothetical protein CUMW_183730 [Citrus unshiu]|uniref:DYW domain-containing protein n=1 Tax=Citrus unshiu TaxID=55188 RepID=A0A2H5Q034_CITUN|nr:hypothetical protein CUMW_183730 [Citrus unshiu]